MTDLDQRIASVLRERAEGEIDTHRLLRSSRARGRRRQLRRRAVTGSALALVGVLGFVGVTGTDLGGLSGRLPWTAASPTVAAPVPPRADGVPGAAQRPDLVATDAAVLHVGVDTTRARYLGWTARAGLFEQVRLRVGNGQPVTVEVSRDADLFTGMGIENFPITAAQERHAYDGTVWPVSGTRNGLIMFWRPVAGLYARASTLGGDRAGLKRAVEALRWNEARRCATPFRLTTLPTGATVTGCSVDVAALPGGVNAALTIRRDRSDMRVRLQYLAEMAGTRSDSNRTVGGRPAYLYPDGTQLELLDIPKAHLIADFGWSIEGITRPTGFTEADATTLLAGARVAKDLSRPETWE